MGLSVFQLDEFINVASTLKLCDKNCLKDIFAFQDIMKRKRDEQRINNKKLSSEIYKSIKAISVDVHDSKKLKNIDISHLREELKTVQENILKFKIQNDASLKKFQEEEKFLTLKMEEFERLLPSYEKVDLDLQTAPKNKPSCSSSIYREKNEDVLNYEKFLVDNGGHSGGWEEEDHLLFLQFMKKFKVKSEFLDALKLRLPEPKFSSMQVKYYLGSFLYWRANQNCFVAAKASAVINTVRLFGFLPRCFFSKEDDKEDTSDLKILAGLPAKLSSLEMKQCGRSEREILKHEKWYSDYLFLREKQRIAVKNWRAEKEEEQAKCRRSRERKNIIKLSKVDKQSIAERKQRLEEWKQKKMEKEREAKEAAQKAIKEKCEKASVRKQMQDMKRAVVEIYKKEKMCERNAYLLKREFKELKERGERAAQANMLLETFRQHDESYIERRRQSRARKLDEEKQRSEECRRLHSHRQLATRDPDRLLRPTLAWQDRLQSKQTDSTSAKPILHLRSLPHFGTPNWRKGLLSS